MNRKNLFLSGLALLVLAAAIALLLVTTSRHEVCYTITDLGALRLRDCEINDKGQVAGTIYLQRQQKQAFIWDATGGMRILEGLVGANDINNRGEVLAVESYGPQELPTPVSRGPVPPSVRGARHGAADPSETETPPAKFLLLLASGERKEIACPGWEKAFPVRLNDRAETLWKWFEMDRNRGRIHSILLDSLGAVIASEQTLGRRMSIEDLNNSGHWVGMASGEALLFDGRQTVPIGRPEGTERVRPITMNDRGQVLVNSSAGGTSPGIRSSIWSPSGGRSELERPWNMVVDARRVNDSGLVVGSGARHNLGTWLEIWGIKWDWAYALADRLGRERRRVALLWKGGKLYDLNDLIPKDSGWENLSSARDINDRGQIVGEGMKGGEAHAFLLTPVAGAENN